jgi:hypothetical protein
MKRFLRFFGKAEEIVVVSGLPRSGTSMMMSMLTAGGMQPLTDEVREADEDNPKGYYELERVKRLDKGDHTWLDEARGKTVKIISGLLVHLPATERYRVIFMRRALPEILASQKKMLIRRGEDPNQAADEEIEQLYRQHLAHVEAWIHEQENVSVLYLSYNDVIESPKTYARRLNAFLGGGLDETRMCEVVDTRLYRQRASQAAGLG